MKCDMHVHSWHSGMCNTPLASRICRECYSQPQDVYAHLKARGMDLVTLTDHDSICGMESLRHHPDVFVSEEVTCRMPSGTIAHLGAYDITERDHIQIQSRQDDFPRLMAYCSERRLLVSINHVFSNLTGRRATEDFSWFEDFVPAVEIRNGQMQSLHNRLAERLAAASGKIELGGSDAHFLRSAGTTYTEVKGAQTKEEFFQGVRCGNALVRGENGGYFKLTRDIAGIIGNLFRQDRWTVALSPLTIFLPLVTLATVTSELLFAALLSRRLSEATVEPAAECSTFPVSPGKVISWP